VSDLEIDVDRFASASADGAVVIDVRQTEEYVTGHVAGAELMPLGDVVARLDEIPADRPVYVICQTGGRSLKAAQFLRAQGYDATSVAGGTKAWIESGRDVVRGRGPEPRAPQYRPA
jgi:rhodanese-related sulfurtransferase